MPDEKATDIDSLFKRQTTAGDLGSPPLSNTERDEIARVNLEALSSALETPDKTVPPDIVPLIKKQLNAGTPGNPDLSPEELKKLTEYYKGRK